MSKTIEIQGKHFGPLKEKWGYYGPKQIVAFAKDNDLPCPSEPTVSLHLRGKKDLDISSPSVKARAEIETVYEALGGDRRAKAIAVEINEFGQRSWLLTQNVLQESRFDLALMLTVYYGLRIIPEDGIRDVLPDITSPEILPDNEVLKSIVLNQTPVPLFMKQAWIPPALIPLSKVDGQMKSTERGCAADLDKDFAGLRKKFLNPHVKDDQTYQLSRLAVDAGDYAFFLYDATYDRYQNSGECLAWELARAYHQLPYILRRQSNETPLQYIDRIERSATKLRSSLNSLLRIRPTVEVFNFTDRSVGVGINTLTIMAYRKRSSMFLLHKRRSQGSNIAEAEGQLHVIPAGTFQPLCQNTKEFRSIEFSMQRNQMRETGEELLGKEELIRKSVMHDPDYPYDVDSELKKLKRMYDQKYVSSYLLGSAIDLLTLKCEVMTLQIIDGDRCRDERLELSGSREEGEAIPITWSQEALLREIATSSLLPAGAGCISIAYFRFPEISNKIDELLKRHPPSNRLRRSAARRSIGMT